MSTILEAVSGRGNGLTPRCDGWCEPKRAVTHIGSKGYAYCEPCAIERRSSGYERTRRMRVWELNLLRAGKPLPSYEPHPQPKAAPLPTFSAIMSEVFS